MIIRPAEEADAEGIARVDIDSHVAAYAQIFDVSQYARAPECIVERWRRILTHTAPAGAPENVLVGPIDGVVEGYVAFGKSRDTDGAGIGEIGALYVHPGRWRQRVGDALMKSACGELVALGFKQATLWVIDANAQGRLFYEKQGWALDGTERTAHSREELRYRKRLI